MSHLDAVFSGSIPEVYDSRLGPVLFEPYALDIAERFRGFAGAILETAAGTGRVTRALAAAAPQARIVATDLNAPMIAKAAERVGSDAVVWRQADAQALPFGDAAFDAVVCQFGVMFFPDKAAGFAEARCVLRPGGRFVFSVWDELALNPVSLAVHEAVGEIFPDDPPAFIARAPFGYHDEARIRAALEAVGFSAIAVERVAKESNTPVAGLAEGMCLGSPLRGEIEARRPGAVQAVAEAVSARLVERYGPGEVGSPMQALVVTANR